MKQHLTYAEFQASRLPDLSTLKEGDPLLLDGQRVEFAGKHDRSGRQAPHHLQGTDRMTCELPECEHRQCVCGHAECGHADENVQPNCSDCRCSGFRLISLREYLRKPAKVTASRKPSPGRPNKPRPL